MMIGIIILNFNTYGETINCIKSIYSNELDMSSKRIYLVDNASPDGSGKRLKEYYDSSDIEVILSDINLGFSGGNNLGIKAALSDGCEYLFLFNSDVMILNNAISIMAEYMSKHDEVVAIGPHIVDSQCNYSQVARRGLRFLDVFFTSKRYYSYDTGKPFMYKGMSYGCCFGIRASFAKTHDLLDDNIFLYCEEDTIAHLIEKDSDAVACILPDAKIKHLEGAATGLRTSRDIARGRYHRWESEIYVLKKYAHCTKLQLELVRLYRNTIISLLKGCYPDSYSRFL